MKVNHRENPVYEACSHDECVRDNEPDLLIVVKQGLVLRLSLVGPRHFFPFLNVVKLLHELVVVNVAYWCHYDLAPD